jgi:cellulose synthase/poly-beta-1,6-N-acetylglucosamine synthase-like glycosyltransferase
MAAPVGQRLSVIIPLGPEETLAAGLLEQLLALPAGSEILLVGADIMASKPTCWPDRLPLYTVSATAGRARQMNAGARTAAGAWLWFLHADTRLTPEALPALARFLDAGEPALGWFRLRFGEDGPALTRLNAWGANIRSGVFGLPFGDQGLVLPATCFAAAGGFDEAATAGEDHLLVWTLRGAGVKLSAIDAALVTSGRKYAKYGWAATTWRHWMATMTQAYAGWRNTTGSEKH